MQLNFIKPFIRDSVYSQVIRILALSLMLTPYLSAEDNYSQIFFEIGLLLLGVSFVVSSNTEINDKISFYVSLISGTVIIIFSLLNIYKLYT